MKQGKYLYETHMHTLQGSACSDSPGRDYISRYIDRGYDGIIVTDHFYRGNCRVDRHLPWPQFVDAFMSGYLDAREEGEKRGFSVFFGWEENIDGDEYLIYGPEREFLLDHPEMKHWSRREQYEAVRAAGGAVVQAHPFRARWYLSAIHLAPYSVDAVEGVNAANEDTWNTLAMRYAASLGLPVIAGSDNHHAERMEDGNLAGVMLDTPLTCAQDLADLLRGGRSPGLWIPHPVPPFEPDMRPDLPADWILYDGTVIDGKWEK